jgi:hypothetical protein
MLDDAFKITLDVVYPPLKGDALPERDQDDSFVNVADEKFQVQGYPNEVNMWGTSFYKFRF